MEGLKWVIRNGHYKRWKYGMKWFDDAGDRRSFLRFMIPTVLTIQEELTHLLVEIIFWGNGNGI